MVGLTTSFVAELWGLRDGILMCYNLNISSLIVELDAKSIVDALGNSEFVNNVISPFLDDCRLLHPAFIKSNLSTISGKLTGAWTVWLG